MGRVNVESQGGKTGLAQDSDRATIEQNVRTVFEKIRDAALRAGRAPDAVRLVDATKGVTVERVRVAAQAGVTILGESRLQEALPKIEALGSPDAVRWHFIGQLQRRKVKSVVERFDMIHSVDSVDLAEEIDRRADVAGIRQAVLLEINIGGEATKAGFSPVGVRSALPRLDRLSRLEIRGLMTVPPQRRTSEETRRFYQELRHLAGALASSGLERIRMTELSMGMSNDYTVAVEEGATYVRVGTAIFGDRGV